MGLWSGGEEQVSTSWWGNGLSRLPPETPVMSAYNRDLLGQLFYIWIVHFTEEVYVWDTLAAKKKQRRRPWNGTQARLHPPWRTSGIKMYQVEDLQQLESSQSFGVLSHLWHQLELAPVRATAVLCYTVYDTRQYQAFIILYTNIWRFQNYIWTVVARHPVGWWLVCWLY
jgi:hypothetical protein